MLFLKNIMLNMTRSMFGISLSPDDDKLCPFRAYVSWLRHFIPLHGMLAYYAPSGLTLHSPERALYLNDGSSPSDRERITIISPERALYLNDRSSPSDIERITIISPEGALYLNDGSNPSEIGNESPSSALKGRYTLAGM